MAITAEQNRSISDLIRKGTGLASDWGVPLVGGAGRIFGALLDFAGVSQSATADEAIAQLRDQELAAAQEESDALAAGREALERAEREGR